MSEKLQQWQALAAKELKGASPESLTWHTLEGIAVKPLYTEEDVAGLDVLWSFSPGNVLTPRTEATLAEIAEDIPMMSVGSNVVIFEAFVPYTPVTDILTISTMNETVAMRPRFLPTLCMTGIVC